MIVATDWKSELNVPGFVNLQDVLDVRTINELGGALDGLPQSDATLARRNTIYGVRNLTELSSEINEFSQSKLVRWLIQELLGTKAFLARSIYFDKSLKANWNVPWHQDLTIAVNDKVDQPGFGPSTKKAGKWHVQPPIKVLEKMVTLRFHLDAATIDNGALKVCLGSHRYGRLTQSDIQARIANGITICSVQQGDCIVMRPLLLHASSAGVLPSRRRVVHFEFASDSLPEPINWNGS